MIRKRLLKIAIALLALSLVVVWLNKQEQQAKKNDAINSRILLKTMQQGFSNIALISLQGDLCQSSNSASLVVGDISKIDGGLLLQQDLTPEAKKLSSSTDFALKSFRDALSTLPSDTVKTSDVLMENRVASLNQDLMKWTVQLQKGNYKTAKVYFMNVPKILIGMGVTGCGQESVTNPTARASLLKQHPEYRTINRGISNDAICKLQTETAKVQETLASINRSESLVSEMSKQLLVLAQQLDDAASASQWAHEDSPTPTDASTIKQLKIISGFVYGIRVKYAQIQSKQNQAEIAGMQKRIAPIAVEACASIKSDKPKF